MPRKNSQLIEPRLPGGFLDFPPSVMIPRQHLFDTVRRVYESFGYLPLETSPVEFMETLTGGKPPEMRLYSVGSTEKDEHDQLALRFDLTVPLARFVAANRHHIPWPFRRYQMGPVWRGERRQKGRYNQFWQCDVDLVGSTSLLADAEIVSLIDATLRALGLERFTIHCNNRKLLNALPAYAGFPMEQLADVLRVLDKHDKLGPDALLKILSAPAGEPVPVTDEDSQTGIGLPVTAVENIKRFVSIPADTAETTLAELRALLGAIPVGAEGIDELATIVSYLQPLGIRPRINPLTVRGLGYYSGPIFETTLDDAPQYGSICSGGRYDGLVNRFADFPAPAVGTSVGIDRLLAAMTELGTLKETMATAKIGIARTIDPHDAVLTEKIAQYALQIAQRLRTEGVPNQVYVGAETTLAGQLGELGRAEIPLGIILGPDELAKQVITVKHLGNRTQEKDVPVDQAVRVVKQLLD